jgi:3-oxoacyl-[acyl-carrier protein] reductase
MNLQNQVALVTGASRGIGKAIALELARQGAKVVGTATTENGAQAIGEYLAEFGGKGMVLNVTDAQQCAAVIDDITKNVGSVSILVNNAGITQDQLAMRMKDEEWDNVIATNLSAVGRLSRAVLRGMMKAKQGRIINITSVVGASGNPGQMNYAAAKAGVAGMTRALAREIGSRNITVNCVGLHRYRHDPRIGRKPARSAARPDPAGTPRQAGRHRLCGGFPGRSASGLHHGHGTARERRDVHELIGKYRGEPDKILSF